MAPVSRFALVSSIISWKFTLAIDGGAAAPPSRSTSTYPWLALDCEDLASSLRFFMFSRSALRLANPRQFEACESAKLSFFLPVSAAIINDGSGIAWFRYSRFDLSFWNCLFAWSKLSYFDNETIFWLYLLLDDDFFGNYFDGSAWLLTDDALATCSAAWSLFSSKL